MGNVGRREAAWYQPLHRAITYGQESEERSRTLELWDEYFASATRDGCGLTRVSVMVIQSAIAHIFDRTTNGGVTAIPAGILLMLVGLSSVSLAFVPDDPMPQRAHFHMALGFFVTAAVFFRWPRWQPPKMLGFSAVVLGTSWMHGATGAAYERTSDYVILTGAFAFATGAIALVVFGFTRRRSWRSAGFSFYALAAVLVGVGDLDWWNIAEDPTYALVCGAAASAALIAANLIMRLRTQEPPLAKQCGLEAVGTLDRAHLNFRLSDP